jgi:hypothetical protein
MKNALISPNEKAVYISGVTPENAAVFVTIENAYRVAEVADQSYELAPPLFWIECEDDVVADKWYFDVVTQSLIKVPDPAPMPTVPVDGAQSF